MGTIINNLPEWYWKKGLHDAIVVSIKYYELQYAFTDRNPDRNYLSIEIDARNAMFDTRIVELRFYNSKFSDAIIKYAGYWWINDTLYMEGSKFSISIDIMSANDSGKINILFDRAEVIRQL